MKESATSAVATAPIANANGAAGPADCTTSVILKAAVTVGATMDRDRPKASGRLRRERKFTSYEPRSVGRRHLVNISTNAMDWGASDRCAPRRARVPPASVPRGLELVPPSRADHA